MNFFLLDDLGDQKVSSFFVMYILVSYKHSLAVFFVCADKLVSYPPVKFTTLIFSFFSLIKFTL
jgi:hypothetical protein